MILLFKLQAIKMPKDDMTWKKNPKYWIPQPVNNGEKATDIINNAPYKYKVNKDWTFQVLVSEVQPKAIRDIRRKSSGFAGMNWMINSIIKRGAIYKDAEITKN